MLLGNQKIIIYKLWNEYLLRSFFENHKFGLFEKQPKIRWNFDSDFSIWLLTHWIFPFFIHQICIFPPFLFCFWLSKYPKNRISSFCNNSDKRLFSFTIGLLSHIHISFSHKWNMFQIFKMEPLCIYCFVSIFLCWLFELDLKEVIFSDTK